MIVLMGLGLLILAGVAWWWLPRWQATRIDRRTLPKDTLIEEVEDRFRQTIAQALAGVLLLVSGLVGIQQYLETVRSSEQAAKAQQYAKSFELLDKSSSHERMAGVVSLLDDWARRKVAGDSDEAVRSRVDSILPVYIAFIQERTKFDVSEESCPKFIRPVSLAVGIDVQAALDSVRRIISYKEEMQATRPRDIAKLDFRGLNLSRANLAHMDLSGANLAFADLSEAILVGAKLNGANLYCTNLYGADLRGVDMSPLNEDAAEPKITSAIGAMFTKAKLMPLAGKKANLSRALFYDAIFNESDMQGADLRGSVLSSTNFFRGNISGIEVDSRTDIFDACFTQVDTANSMFTTAMNREKLLFLSKPDDPATNEACSQRRYASGKAREATLASVLWSILEGVARQTAGGR